MNEANILKVWDAVADVPEESLADLADRLEALADQAEVGGAANQDLVLLTSSSAPASK